MMSEVISTNNRTKRASYRVKLNEKPCAVKFVESFCGFVVGTYDCLSDISSAKERFPDLDEKEVEKIYEHTNHRIGSLNFLRAASDDSNCPTYQLQVVHRCKHGGIFDMSIVEDRIYAAHANGFVARYSFEDGQFKQQQSIKVTTCNTTLLTSIDTCSGNRNTLLSIVGDSRGQVTLLIGANLDKILASCDVTSSADPVWQVKFMPTQSVNESVTILAAAEDSSWYIYKVHMGEMESSFEQIFRNQDFQAGVTSICFLTPFGHESQGSVLIGSYDESMRHYELKFNDSEPGHVSVRSRRESAIVIEGGGIWRLHRVKDRLYIAAMYAGSYLMELRDLFSSQPDRVNKCDKVIELDSVDSSDCEMAPLHYGIDLCPQDSFACIVDYNNNYCIFVEQP